MKYLDVHTHVFPDNIAAKVIHQLDTYYHGKWSGTGTLSDILTSMKEGNITRSVIFSAATKPQQVVSVNNYITEIQRTYPDLFYGFGTMHPDFPDPAGELERMKELGLRGMKFHPDFQQFEIDDPRMMKIYELAGSDFVMLFHIGDEYTDRSSPVRLRRVIEAYPHLKIIAAHMGCYSKWDEYGEYLVDTPIYVDVSSTMQYISPERTKELALAHGIDKVLFASDYPAARHLEAIRQVHSMGLTPEQEELVFYRNAERLLNVTL